MKTRSPRVYRIANCLHCQRLMKICSRGLCSRCGKKHEIRDRYQPVRNLKIWTTKEVAILRDMVRSGLTNSGIAKLLGRRQQQIRSSIARFKCERYRCTTPERFEKLKKKLLTMNIAGKTTEQIADALGCSKNTTRYMRRKLGIPCQLSPAERGRRGAIAVNRKYGKNSFVKKYEEDRIWAAAQGWPAGTTRRGAEILALLREKSMTMTELALALSVGYWAIKRQLVALRAMKVVYERKERVKNEKFWEINWNVVEEDRLERDRSGNLTRYR